MSIRDTLSVRVAAGLGAGLIGGIVYLWLAPTDVGTGAHIGLSALLGILFGWSSGERIHSPGAGFIWGAAFGLVWWLVGVLTIIPLLSGIGLGWTIGFARLAFPQLVGNLLAFGVVLGMSYSVLVAVLRRFSSRPSESSATPAPSGQARLPPAVRAMVIGGIGGLLGAWVFLRGIETAEFFPFAAGLIGAEGMMVGLFVHYSIGTIIGVSFGLLFHREVRGLGAGVIWGLAYGMLWWLIGPLTLAGWISAGGMAPPDWSLAAAEGAFPPLLAHLLYGALVGLFYALANKVWQALFVDSDPLNRSIEGAGTRSVRGALMGQAGGVLGGLLFTIVMVGIDALPNVASLVGAESRVVGFIVHLIVAVTIGTTYGLLFQRESADYGAAMAWGMSYGFLWWLVGTNTLFALILRLPLDWSAEAVISEYPALVGHLLYGASLGLLFHFLVRRYATPRRSNAPAESALGDTTPAAAPAAWTIVLLLGTLLPLLIRAGGEGVGY